MRTRTIVLGTTAVALAAALSAAPAAASRADADAPAARADAVLIDARHYAAATGVSFEEAVRRLALQDRAGELEAALTQREPRTFGGLWLDHDGGFRVTVAMTDAAAAARARTLAATAGLGDVTAVRTVRWSLAELIRASTTARTAVAKAGRPATSGVDVRNNRAEVYVTDTAVGVPVAAPAVLEKVATLGRNAGSIHGGQTINTGCTTGFPVYDSWNVKGVLTSGHCSNDALQNIGGVLVKWKAEVWSGAYDQQWLTPDSSADTVLARFWDGSAQRTIAGMKTRSVQTVGAYVCKYGRITGYNCGWINDKNYNPVAWAPKNNSPTFIRVDPSGANLIEQGDSGGPWFNGNYAYGITKGYAEDRDGVYQAIDYMSTLGVFLMIS